MRKIYAITLRGEQPPIGGMEWATSRIWVTWEQMDKIMRSQDDPTKKNRLFWIADRVFRVGDINYAKEYDADDRQIQARLKNMKADYVLEALRLEEEQNDKA